MFQSQTKASRLRGFCISNPPNSDCYRRSIACNGRCPSQQCKHCCLQIVRFAGGVQVSVSAKKRKNTNKVRAYLFVVRSTQNKWVLTHLVRCTDTACLFVCYVRCARFLQMLCACISLCLRSAETCSSAIVTEGQSRATDGARPNNASIVACKLFDLQGEFKFGVRRKRKNTNKVRAYLFVVRSPRLELGRCNHTPLKRTRLPIPP